MKSPEIFDKFYNAHWFLTGYSCRNFSELLREGGCQSPVEFIGVMENDVNTMIFDTEQFNQAAEYYADKLVNDDKWRESMYEEFYKYAKLYFEAGKKLLKVDLSKLTNVELIELMNGILPLQERVRILGVLLNGLVLDGHNHLSNKFRNELKEYIKDGSQFDKYWSKLTQVIKMSLRQRKDLEIAKLVDSGDDDKMKNIYNDYCWLDYMYYGPPTSFKQFEKELKEAKKNNSKFGLVEELKEIKEEQEDLIRKLNFDKRARFLVSLAQEVLWQKGYRKDVEYHGFYCYEPIIKEVAKRKGQRDWKNLLYMLPWEMEGYVMQDRPDNNEIEERRKFSCLVVNADGVKMLTGKEARELYNNLGVEKDFSDINEVKGQCAYAGKAKGVVKLVFTPEDMDKMNEGDILVSQATSPDLISAMKKASAMVTNTGGLICHAAITSRELKIPCVVGTNNATLVFKDGDMIEVEAESGVVRKI